MAKILCNCKLLMAKSEEVLGSCFRNFEFDVIQWPLTPFSKSELGLDH